MKFVVYGAVPTEVDWYIIDGTTNMGTYGTNLTVQEYPSSQAFTQACNDAMLTYALANSFSITLDDIIWPNYPVRVFSNPSLAVNTARKASDVHDTLVVASVEIDANLSLSGGAKGTVSLQYADNNTFTTNLKTASIGVNGNTGTLTIGLNTTQAGGGVVMGIVPAGKFYRLFTTNTTGTPTFGTPVIQEISL